MLTYVGLKNGVADGGPALNQHVVDESWVLASHAILKKCT